MYIFPLLEFNEDADYVLNIYVTDKERVEAKTDLKTLLYTFDVENIRQVGRYIKESIEESIEKTGYSAAKGPVDSSGAPLELDEERGNEYHIYRNDQSITTVISYGECYIYLEKGNYVLEDRRQRKIRGRKLLPFLEKVYEYKEKMRLKWTV